ncbi:MAG TPA: two-component regulator propeller domain-containing protein [Draconibacterium sp.]|nr:two-component regulator propeller domain-containing protein [Draconibacterium sp.]
MRSGQGIIGSILFIFLSAGCLLGQPDYLQLNQFSPADGLSSSAINSITQDQNGFIWIGTRNGLNRFDGNTFKVYQHVDVRKSIHALPGNVVLATFIDEMNNLYVGTNDGLSRYDPERDNFYNFKIDTLSCLYQRSIEVLDIVENDSGTFFLASSDGLILFNPQKNSCRDIQLTNDPGTSKTVVNDLFLAKDGRLWIATKSGLYTMNSTTGEITQIDMGFFDEDFSQVTFNAVIADQSEIIWLASSAHGLFMLATNADGDECLKNFVHNPDNPNSIPGNQLLCLEVDKDDNLWIGAEHHGVYCMNKDRQYFKHYLSTKTDPFVKQTYTVESLFFDNGDNLWFGTHANGIALAPKDNDAILSYTFFSGGDLNRTNNMVNAFYEKNDSTIWVATDGSGINVLNKKTGFFTAINAQNSDLPNNYISAFTGDENGNIWMTSWGTGLVFYRPDNDSYTVYNTENSSLPENNLYHVCKGNNDDILIASANSGFVQFFPNENMSMVYTTANSNLASNNVSVIRKADDTSFYIGTKAGLFKFYPEKNLFEDCSTAKNIEVLKGVYVYDILVEDSTSVWLATLTGLNHYNPITGDVKTYTIDDGLPNNCVNGIMKDADGYIWCLTLAGLCRYNVNQGVFETYLKSYGLPSDEYRPKSVLIDSNHKLYFGSINGFSIIDPDKLKRNNQIPVVKFTGFEMYNKEVLPGEPGSPLKRIISETDEIKIPARNTVLTFHFSVLDYKHPEAHQYAFILENFDEDWTYCGTRRQVTYTNLNPGKYILRVKGANSNGIWNERGAALKLIIVPPWWRTWWFLSLLFVFFVATFLFVNYLRVKTLEQQKNKLELAVKRRTKELADINATKDKLFAIIAHDLRNPFNVILGYTDVLLEGYEKFDKKMMDQILGNLKSAGDSAFALLENLMNWSRSQRGLIEFSPEVIVLNNLVETVVDEIDAVAKRKSIEIINYIRQDNLNIFGDEVMLLLVFRNLLTNAVKFSNPGEAIYLRSGETEKNFIPIGIQDNGIGIDPEKQEAIFSTGKEKPTVGTKGERGSGLGLVLCKEFMERHNGKIWVQSSPGEGSVFWVTLPVSEEALLH